MFNPGQLLQNQQKQEMLMAACMLLQQQPGQSAGVNPQAWLQARALAAGGGGGAPLSASPSSSLTSTSSQGSSGAASSEESSTEASSTSDASDQMSDDEFFSQDNTTSEAIRDTKNETFPMKLYRMLYEAEKEEKDDIVSFAASGRAFHIHKPDQFIADVMPKYFTTTRLASFQRQLNLYGFRRLTHGVDKGGYTHCQQYFIKNKRALCNKIRRKSQGLVSKPNAGAAMGYNPLYAGGAAAMNAPMMGAMGMFGRADINSMLGAQSALSSLAAANYNARLGLLAQASQQGIQQPHLSSLMGLVRQGLLDRSTVGGDESTFNTTMADNNKAVARDSKDEASAK